MMNSFFKKIGILVAVLLGIFSLGSTSAWGDIDSLSWTQEAVGLSGYGTRSVDIFVDDAMVIHLAYSGCPGGHCQEANMVYAKKGPSDVKWKIEVVDNEDRRTGFTSSMAISKQGAVHLVYANHKKQRLRHAYKLAGQKKWKIKKFRKYGGWFSATAIVGETLYFSHAAMPRKGEFSRSYLEFGTFSDGKYQFETVENEEASGQLGRMTLQKDNQPTISYISGGYPVGHLRIAEKGPSGWKTMNIDTMVTKNSLVYDQKGYFHMIYDKDDPIYNPQIWDLWYATNAPDGVLKTMMIDGGDPENRDTGGHVRLAIDAKGGLHGVYRDYSRQTGMKYIRKRPGRKDWEFHFVDRTVAGGVYNGIFIDKKGGMHIAHEMGGQVYYRYCKDCTDY